MSAQSGITATPELLQAFSKAQQSSHCRALVIHIDKEALVPGSEVPKQASEAKDFEQLAGVLQESDPCYVAFKLDNGTCMLVAYVPNDANVRAKMLVASTQATLIKSLGAASFSDQLFASDKEDLSAAGWKRHLEHKAASAPLSEREEEAKLVKKLEGMRTEGSAVRSGDLPNTVGTPWTEDAEQAVAEFASSSSKALYLTMDVPKETVTLLSEGDALQIPTDTASWTFYRVETGSIVFIYSCPSGSPIKSRMLFSSSSRAVASKAESLGVKIAKKLETSDPVEITDDYIRSELQEDSSTSQTAPLSTASSGFAKPRRPGRR